VRTVRQFYKDHPGESISFMFEQDPEDTPGWPHRPVPTPTTINNTFTPDGGLLLVDHDGTQTFTPDWLANSTDGPYEWRYADCLCAFQYYLTGTLSLGCAFSRDDPSMGRVFNVGGKERHGIQVASGPLNVLAITPMDGVNCWMWVN